MKRKPVKNDTLFGQTTAQNQLREPNRGVCGFRNTSSFHYVSLIAVALLSLFATSSCASRYYAPNQHNAPLFKEKGEVRLSVSGSGGNDVSAVEVQGAYAVTDKTAVMINTLVARPGDNSGSHGFLMEGAGGYFRNLRKRLVFESYGGAGVGKAFNRYGTTNSSDLRFAKLFVQPDFGFTSTYFDAVVSARLSGLHYYKMDMTFDSPGATNAELEYIRRHPTSLLAEPAFILRAGWKYAKMQVQISNSFNLTAPQLQQEKVMLSIGFYLSYAKRFKN